ncbi:cyclic pyranopterin monophosphate synthase subunit MoaC [Tamaricihabitans halophyticus]|uniref:Cyclic pyranopterin monophosphate synthase n=1 Tax=Tamaricihabitans halophyticus TaxID=1262583 RepID=A0A4R2RC54_9PSEU|nr:cyclic pyranopterin monophosphate synthase MoaC [Tamaricihabitans halophyticus]TCP57005.1 cyclic pyranopterin monophosphate synthase subunit MoaC [Tamaricihabitans halophyticus]
MTEQQRLSHLDETGQARFVDVSAKSVTVREAVAGGAVTMAPQTLATIRAGDAPKGDVLGTARLAGIMAAKRTGELIPLCHPLGIDGAEVDFEFASETTLRITARVRVHGRTGVEMEALTAVSVAALTIYDMAKAIDKGITIGDIALHSKTGGKSGSWTRTAD